eukprot:scaffold103590_cov54-Attheya_sp.AAC.3
MNIGVSDDKEHWRGEGSVATRNMNPRSEDRVQHLLGDKEELVYLVVESTAQESPVTNKVTLSCLIGGRAKYSSVGHYDLGFIFCCMDLDTREVVFSPLDTFIQVLSGKFRLVNVGSDDPILDLVWVLDLTAIPDFLDFL